MNIFPHDKLTPELFQKFQKLAKDKCGVYVSDSKIVLVRTRMISICIKEKCNFSDLSDKLFAKNNTDLMKMFIDKITTHETFLFRERNHFDYLKNQIFPNLPSKRLRFWSAATSTGEEAYSLSLYLKKHWKGTSQIIGSDISEVCLDQARRNNFIELRMREVTPAEKVEFFDVVPGKNDLMPNTYKIKKSYCSLIQFFCHSLVDPLPEDYGKFDIVFLRNVLIYFDAPTQKKIIQNIFDTMNEGAYLFLGHSESARDYIKNLELVSPTIYKKVSS